jgi:hypothetical protein
MALRALRVRLLNTGDAAVERHLPKFHYAA